MTDSMRCSDPFGEAVTKLFAFTHIDHLLGDGTHSSIAWKELKESWDNLELDQYMNDNGHYRERRFCKAKYYLKDHTLWMKEHDSYYQPPRDNPLNGGVDRWFGRVMGTTFDNQVVNKLLKIGGQRLANLTGQDVWNINLYQNRIIAEGGKVGKPSPEGIHSDGVKFTLLLLINRFNVIGGENIIYDRDKKPIFTHTLAAPGDCIVFCEHMTLHYASPISQIKSSEIGNRDILVVEFY